MLDDRRIFRGGKNFHITPPHSWNSCPPVRGLSCQVKTLIRRGVNLPPTVTLARTRLTTTVVAFSRLLRYSLLVSTRDTPDFTSHKFPDKLDQRNCKCFIRCGCTFVGEINFLMAYEIHAAIKLRGGITLLRAAYKMQEIILEISIPYSRPAFTLKRLGKMES